MKRIAKQAISLLLCCALLLSAIPAVSAARKVDFQAILDAGSVNHNSVYIVTEPSFYVSSMEPFHGDYAIYSDIVTGDRGIVDYRGNIVYTARSSPSPWEVIMDNVFLSDGCTEGNGYLYDFSGNRILDMSLWSNEVRAFTDRVTGETAGFCVGGDISLDLEEDDSMPNSSFYGFFGRADGAVMHAAKISFPWNGNVTIQPTERSKWGVSRLFGEELLPAVYDYLYFIAADKLIVQEDGKYGIMNLDGSSVAEPVFDYFRSYYKRGLSVIIFGADGKYGLYRADGTVIAEPVFDTLRFLEWNDPQSDTDLSYRVMGVIDGETHEYIGTELGLTLCEEEPTPEPERTPLKNGMYLLPCEGGSLLVNEENEPLIDGVVADLRWMTDDALYLYMADTWNLRVYDWELNLLHEREHYGDRISNALVCFCYGSDGPYAEIFDEHGSVTTIMGAQYAYLCERGGMALRRDDGMIALFDGNGEQVTDYIYAGLGEVSGLYDPNPYTYVLACLPEEDLYIMLDSRTWEPVFPENYRVYASTYMLPEGSYFAIVADGKTGVARITSRTEPPFKDVKSSSWYAEPAAFCFNAGLMNGTGDGCFSPKMEMTRAMLVQVLYSISGEKTESFGFTDVPDGKWYSDAVNWAAANEIVSGLGDGKFGPNEPVTRQQIVTMLFKYASLYRSCEGDPAILEAYDDAGSVSSYARTPLAWAVENGMVSGITPTTLEPKMTATRAQIATLLMRFIEYMAAPEEP